MRNSRKKKENRRKDSTTEVGKVETRVSKVTAKKDGKAAVIQAKADLANAKANKRKWLVALLAVGMAVYMFIKSKMIGVG